MEAEADSEADSEADWAFRPGLPWERAFLDRGASFLDSPPQTSRRSYRTAGRLAQSFRENRDPFILGVVVQDNQHRGEGLRCELAESPVDLALVDVAISLPQPSLEIRPSE